MRRVMLSLALVAMLLTACHAERASVVPEPGGRTLLPLTGLTVLQAFPLSPAPHGVAGRLELLVDARLSEAQRDSLWGTGETGPVELLPAVLQVVETTGRIRDRLVLERPLARFESERLTLPGDSPWLLTVDYSASSGSYNGPVTLALSVRESRLQPLESVDEKGASAPIRLMRALKSDWRLEPTHAGQGQDILYVFTRPDFDKGGEFQVTYERLSFEGGRWIRRTRQEPGLWESEGEFPERERFP